MPLQSTVSNWLLNRMRRQPRHATKGYTYGESLLPESIRVARLLPESTAERIRITLQTVSLAAEPAYDALSYTWGRPCTIFSSAAARDAPPGAPLPVVCDGKELLVGKNLHDYLRAWLAMSQMVWEGTDERLRLAREKGLNPPEALWIDAICINQADIAEKNVQVAMMGRIFSQSRRVVVWLGPEDEFARPALDIIVHVSGVSISEAEKLRHLHTDDNCNALHLPTVSSGALRPVFAFLNRSWFTRAWVVQELALAPSLHMQCGMVSFNWAALSQACRVLWESRLDDDMAGEALMEIRGPRLLEPLSYSDGMPVFRTGERMDSHRNLFSARAGHSHNSSICVVALETIRRACAVDAGADFADALPDTPAQRGVRVPMFALLDEARETECLDPRDKIYAFLDIGKRPFYQPSSPSGAARELVADYLLPPAEVYLQAAWYLMLSGNNLDLLSLACKPAADKDRIPGLPSWVPDWSSKRTHALMNGLHAFREGKWSATRQSVWVPPRETILYKPYLSVRAYSFDTICAVADEPGDFLVSKSGIVAAGLTGEYPWIFSPPQQPGEVLWRTLIADSTETQHPAPDFNVLFYNDIWLDAMSRAAREQWQSGEKDEEWRRFIPTQEPLFGAVADSLKRRKNRVEEGPPSPETVMIPVEPGAEMTAQRSLQTINPFIAARASDGGAQISRQAKTESLASGSNPSEADAETSSMPVETLEKDPLEPEFTRLMKRFSRRRRVFRTEEHYLGKGFETVEIGDQSWLLSGARVPVILRHVEGGRYRFIGDAYVHGLMHGEWWSPWNLRMQSLELW